MKAILANTDSLPYGSLGVIQKPARELFSPATLRSGEGALIVLDHPVEGLVEEGSLPSTPAVGSIRNLRRENDNLVADVRISDQDVRKQLDKSGELAISLGYRHDGIKVDPEGNKYHSSIEIDHVALVEAGDARNPIAKIAKDSKKNDIVFCRGAISLDKKGENFMHEQDMFTSRYNDVHRELLKLTEKTGKLEAEKTALEASNKERGVSMDSLKSTVEALESKIESMKKTAGEIALDHKEALKKEAVDAIKFAVDAVKNERDFSKISLDSISSVSELRHAYLQSQGALPEGMKFTYDSKENQANLQVLFENHVEKRDKILSTYDSSTAQQAPMSMREALAIRAGGKNNGTT